MSSSTSTLRALDPAEAYFHLMDGVSPMHFVVFAERTGPLDAERVRASLAILQESDALLAVSIDYDEALRQLVFKQDRSQAIPVVTVDTGTDAWEPWIEAELMRPFERGVAPLVRCHILRESPRGKSCLALTCHHAIGDGRSSADLMRRLLDLVAGGGSANGMGTDAASPVAGGVPLHHQFPASFQWDVQEGALRKAAGALTRDAMRDGFPDAPPWFARSPGPRAMRLLRVRLGAGIVQDLVDATRREGASMHGVLCAAQLIGQYRLFGGAAPHKLLLTCPVDLRHHLVAEASVRPTQLYASNVFSTYGIDGDTSLWPLARQVMARTREQIRRGDGHYFYSAKSVAQAIRSPMEASLFNEVVATALQGSVMSAVGKLEAPGRDASVESISFAIAPSVQNAVFSAASTFAGCMTINMVYDEGNLVEGTVPALAEAMKSLLVGAARQATVASQVGAG
ncbi:hypothetical protein [Ottowia sp.]|uniref:phthiocerol/phthiodiolone dimycocerosyl transferase family protein n=1 Tax=Ottowia sp. TaxID=1898956 RepID=UPI0025FA295D|nr:hypothetical protein [Ottowia sp.]MBK6616492.1 hypothetical protein [Ottowia sp.]